MYPLVNRLLSIRKVRRDETIVLMRKHLSSPGIFGKQSLVRTISLSEYQIISWETSEHPLPGLPPGSTTLAYLGPFILPSSRILGFYIDLNLTLISRLPFLLLRLSLGGILVRLLRCVMVCAARPNILILKVNHSN